MKQIAHMVSQRSKNSRIESKENCFLGCSRQEVLLYKPCLLVCRVLQSFRVGVDVNRSSSSSILLEIEGEMKLSSYMLINASLKLAN